LNARLQRGGCRVKLVILKKGGEPVEVAVNPALITDVRSTPGQFTEIYFGDHRVTVEGTFRQVVDKLSGGEVSAGAAGQTVRSWISTAKA
jgi:hypothetical protein